MQEATQSSKDQAPGRAPPPSCPEGGLRALCGPSAACGIKTPAHLTFPLTSFQDRTQPRGRGQSGSPWSARGSSMGEGSGVARLQFSLASNLVSVDLQICCAWIPPPCLSPPPPRPPCLCGMLTAEKDRQYFYHDLRAASAVVSQEGAAGM